MAAAQKYRLFGDVVTNFFARRVQWFGHVNCVVNIRQDVRKAPRTDDTHAQTTDQRSSKGRNMKTTLLTLALVAMALPVSAQNQLPGAHFIENWDIDQDGAVELEDILSRRADVFVTFDTDENGALDAEEYVTFDEARANDMKMNGGQGNGMRRASEGMTLGFNDVDGNGEVSREEFLARSADWFTVLDRDGDDSVTSADFGRQ